MTTQQLETQTEQFSERIGDSEYYLHRHGSDANGNHSIWVSKSGIQSLTGKHRARKIQTNQNLPKTHANRHMKGKKILNDETRAEILAHLKSSQHSETETEQFSEPGQFYSVLNKHGYKQLGTTGLYQRGSRNEYSVSINKNKWQHSTGKQGKGHSDLDKHLSDVHSTQHSEETFEEEGHVTPERAEEIFASSPNQGHFSRR